jgi:hypothetical protein
MDNSPKNNFIPIISFNHPIFLEIEEKIKSIIADKPNTLDRQVQIRSMLYVTFNTYLTHILNQLDENECLNFINKLEGIDDQAELLNSICVELNYTQEELINNYLHLFSQK